MTADRLSVSLPPAETPILEEGTDGVRVIASILIVESRHCAVLADLSGGGDDVDLLFENEAAPIAVGESEA